MQSDIADVVWILLVPGVWIHNHWRHPLLPNVQCETANVNHGGWPEWVIAGSRVFTCGFRGLNSMCVV